MKAGKECHQLALPSCDQCRSVGIRTLMRGEYEQFVSIQRVGSPSSLHKLPKEPQLGIKWFNLVHDLVSDSAKQTNSIAMAHLKVSVTLANIIGNIQASHFLTNMHWMGKLYLLIINMMPMPFVNVCFLKIFHIQKRIVL